MPNPYSRFIVNASWLIKLRWVAAVGQLLTIVGVVFLLDIKIPMIWALLTIIVVTATSNLLLSLMFASWYDSQARAALPWDQILGLVMVMDMLSLTALLYASGGPTNPFMLFFFVNVSLSALVLSRYWAWSLNVLSVACFGLILYQHHELEPLYLGSQLLPIHSTGQVSLAHLGLLIAFATCSSVIVYFITRLTDELQQQQNDLNLVKERQARGEKIEALGTLAAGAAHELATPLSTIAVVARDVEKAIDENPPNFPGADEVIEDVHLIRSQLDRCRKILDRMASHAGETVGEAFTSISMKGLAEAVVDELPEKGQVQVQIDPKFQDSCVDLPLDSICQALRGLVQNALDVSEQKAEVLVRIDGDVNHWRWQVVDSGEGMSDSILKRISEPFFTTKPAGHGMGLGLFLANNVIQRLGGEIDVKSEVGVGTTVTVTMPLPDTVSNS